MFGKRKKEDDTPKVSLEAPVFTVDEKKVLVNFLSSPVFQKVMKYVRYRLVYGWLTAGCSDDFRRGWLSCLSDFDNLPLGVAEPQEEDEFASMDIQ